MTFIFAWEEQKLVGVMVTWQGQAGGEPRMKGDYFFTDHVMLWRF